MQTKHHCVIMAGGTGTRFWPKSRKKLPKQLLPLCGSSSLLQQTIKTVQSIYKEKNINVVIGNQILNEVKKDLNNFQDVNIIVEPIGRNTAPCIGYMAYRIAHFFSPDDVMTVLPSDHLIEKNDVFLQTLSLGIKTCEQRDVVLALGVKPESPHTGYGYIQTGSAIAEDAISKLTIKQIVSFKEKPDYNTAVEFLKDGNYLWNAGIYIMKVSVIIDAIKKYMPKLDAVLKKIAEHFGKTDEIKVFNELFPQSPSESIDFGIIEKLETSLSIPVDFGWNDLGSWTSLEDVYSKKEYGISNTDNIVNIDSSGLIINVNNAKKLIATLNINDLIIIDTDDVLLVANKNDAQKVKDIVNKLEKGNLEEFL